MSKAIDEIMKCAGRHFDPEVAAFMRELYNEGRLEEIVKFWEKKPS